MTTSDHGDHPDRDSFEEGEKLAGIFSSILTIDMEWLETEISKLSARLDLLREMKRLIRRARPSVKKKIEKRRKAPIEEDEEDEED